MSELKDMQEEVRAWTVRKGWRGPDAPERTFGDEVALIHSEVSEALEAFRQWGFQDATIRDEDEMPLAKPEGVASELADTLIRILDVCAEYGFDLAHEYRKKMDYNETRTHRHGGKNL